MVEIANNIPAPPFDEVVENYQRDVYRLAFQLTGHHHDAEDVAQDAFMKIYASLHTFRGASSLKLWIHRIVVNTYLNKRRKKSWSMLNFNDELIHRTEGNHLDPLQETESQSINQHIQSALQKLSPKERTAFALRHYNEYSVKEVASALKVAEGTVKSLLYRAMQKLRKELAYLVSEC